MRARAITMFLAVMLVGHAAVAQTNDARAERLFRDGLRERDAGQVAGGCAKIRESQQLAPALGTRYQVARCLELEGLLLDALLELERVATQANEAGLRSEADFAARDATRIRPLVPTLTLSGSADATIELQVDDAPAAPGVTVRLNPGRHTITWLRRGYVIERRTVELRPGQALVAAASLAPEEPRDPDLEADDPVPWLLPVGIGLAGLGLVATGTGVGLGVAAENDYDSAVSRCKGTSPPRCPRATVDEVHAIGGRVDVANGLTWGGAGAVALGATGLIVWALSTFELAGEEAAFRPHVDVTGDRLVVGAGYRR